MLDALGVLELGAMHVVLLAMLDAVRAAPRDATTAGMDVSIAIQVFVKVLASAYQGVAPASQRDGLNAPLADRATARVTCGWWSR
jgi:hypothetical protein